jgi:hypothetical protein
MSAITLAQKKLQTGNFQVFLETLDKKGFLTVSIEEILGSEELVEFFKVQKSTRKKTSLSDEERLGQYDGNLCDARLWKEKPKSGGLGYDNIQCSSKKVNGCLCKKHFKMQGEGTLWTGLITEPRSEEPKKPDGTPMFWSTDKDGNDVVKEKKEKKERKKSSGPKKKKDPKEFTEEELLALLAKAKKKEEKEKEEKEKEEKEEKEKEEKEEKEKEEKEEKEQEEKEEKDEKDEKVDEDTEDLSEDEDEYEDITVDGTEYQLNKEDNTVIRKDDFSPVGFWNTDTREIDFDEEE